jgi:hypothetical protein
VVLQRACMAADLYFIAWIKFDGAAPKKTSKAGTEQLDECATCEASSKIKYPIIKDQYLCFLILSRLPSNAGFSRSLNPEEKIGSHI